MTKESQTSKSSPVPVAALLNLMRPQSWAPGQEGTWHFPRIQCRVSPELCKGPACLDLSSGHQKPLANCLWDMSTYMSTGITNSTTPPKHINSFLPFTKGTILPGTQPPSTISSDPSSPFIPQPASSQVLSILPQAVCLSPSFWSLDHLSDFSVITYAWSTC